MHSRFVLGGGGNDGGGGMLCWSHDGRSIRKIAESPFEKGAVVGFAGGYDKNQNPFIIAINEYNSYSVGDGTARSWTPGQHVFQEEKDTVDENDEIVKPYNVVDFADIASGNDITIIVNSSGRSCRIRHADIDIANPEGESEEGKSGLKWDVTGDVVTARNLRCIDFGNGEFWSGGQNGKLANTVNGLQWTEAPNVFGNDTVLDIAFNDGNGAWCAVGTGGKAAIRLKNDYRQVAAYDFIFNRYKNDCDWMIVVDSDEFLFNPQGRDLKEVLTEFDSIDCGGVIVPWTVFGPSNHVIQPPGLFIDNFVTSHGVRNRTWGTVKSITKTAEYESCGHVHYMNVRKPYVLEDGKPFELVGRCETQRFMSQKFRINHYHSGSMEDWVNRTVSGGWGVSRTIHNFKGTLGKKTNRDACRFSKSIRDMLGMPVGDATLENTVFVSTCDYEKPDDISFNLRRTAEHFGVPLTWASYGEPFENLIETKVKKLLKTLQEQKANGKKYAFVLDCRDVVFADSVQNILADFNLIYKDGVMFNADLLDKLWPLHSEELLWRIRSVHGSHGIANSGVYCGRIDEIVNLWHRLLNIRWQIQDGRSEEFCTKVLANDPAFRNDGRVRRYLKGDYARANGKTYDGSEYHDPKITVSGDLLDDDQIFVQIAQTDANYPIRVDRYKQLLAAFDQKLPDLHVREEYDYDDARSIGTAKILHSPWMSRYDADWNAWVEKEVMR